MLCLARYICDDCGVINVNLGEVSALAANRLSTPLLSMLPYINM